MTVAGTEAERRSRTGAILAIVLISYFMIITREAAYDVRFTKVDDDAALAAVDAGYRAKYGHYASIVDHLEEEGPRAATLGVHPA